MALTLHHYTIRATDLDASVHFYEQVLGLTVGPRPAFEFAGAWLYRGDHADYSNAAVHLISAERHLPVSSPNPGAAADVILPGAGAIDHIAFFASELTSMLNHLQRIGHTYHERTVPGLNLHQVFLHDPQGIKIELNYPAAEKLAHDAAL